MISDSYFSCNKIKKTQIWKVWPVFPLSIELISHNTNRHIVEPLDMADAARVGVVSSHQLQFKISEVVDTDTVGTGMRSGDETGPVPLSSYKTILPTDIT